MEKYFYADSSLKYCNRHYSLDFCAVKSPATMTDNDRAPEAERTVTLKKVEVHSGAGLVHVNLTTSLTTPMPKIV